MACNIYGINFAIILLNLVAFCASVELFTLGQKACTCVPYFQCSDETGNVITDGSGLLESRKYSSGKCTGYFDVCCNAVIDETKEEVIQLKGCGYQKPEKFPWSGALFYQLTTNDLPIYKCGVSMINREIVLTAAHCLVTGLLSVQVGGEKRYVKNVILHPLYNENTLQNDIALLALNEPIRKKNLETICIAPLGIALEATRECFVTTYSRNDAFSDSKLSVRKVPIVQRDVCENKLKETRLGYFFKLHRTFLCAGLGEETCDGDGGSPLVCPIPGQPGRYHQVGIVSWGIGCGENQLPQVFVNLPIFRDWIDSELIKKGLETNSYRY